MELKTWTMRVYVQDKRTKAGERILKTYCYPEQSERFMKEEVADLSRLMYPAPKYRIEVDPTYVTVKSLMTGEPVQIYFTDRGTAQDPSQERYWTL
jgi:hypothetical protein